MNVVRPQPGQGWERLIMNPQYNGGDEYPPEMAVLVDEGIATLTAVGVLHEGTPSLLLTFQPAGPGKVMVHWANDGRRPLRETFDLLDAVTYGDPTVKFLAFCRRPALVRLLAARGWTLQSHEDVPFMALMVCQRQATPPAD